MNLSGDDYGRFEPGLAGYKRPGTEVCHIPGIQQMGEVKYNAEEVDQKMARNGPIRSRGYECDREGYEDLCPPETGTGKLGPSVLGMAQYIIAYLCTKFHDRRCRESSRKSYK